MKNLPRARGLQHGDPSIGEVLLVAYFVGLLVFALACRLLA